MQFSVSCVLPTFQFCFQLLSSYFLLSCDERKITFMLSFSYRGNNEESTDESNRSLYCSWVWAVFRSDWEIHPSSSHGRYLSNMRWYAGYERNLFRWSSRWIRESPQQKIMNWGSTPGLNPSKWHVLIVSGHKLRVLVIVPPALSSGNGELSFLTWPHSSLRYPFQAALSAGYSGTGVWRYPGLYIALSFSGTPQLSVTSRNDPPHASAKVSHNPL